MFYFENCKSLLKINSLSELLIGLNCYDYIILTESKNVNKIEEKIKLALNMDIHE